MPKTKHCQSCDMPISKDPQGGGTRADGTRTENYCSLCFENGAFIWQGTDVRAYQAMVVEEMSKNGFWRPVAWLLTRRIPKLERWKT